MLVRVWEYEVVPGREAEFEQLYGSAGAWVQLFARSTGHVSTEPGSVHDLGWWAAC
jgi:hypothetical protein